MRQGAQQLPGRSRNTLERQFKLGLGVFALAIGAIALAQPFGDSSKTNAEAAAAVVLREGPLGHEPCLAEIVGEAADPGLLDGAFDLGAFARNSHV